MQYIDEGDLKYLLTYPDLENPYGEIVLSNDHVLLQRYVVEPGKWEGVHSHPGNQLYVHIKGGLWSGRLNSESEYSGEVDKDGDLGWLDAIPLCDQHDSGNTGDEPIDIVWVTCKSDMPITPERVLVPQVYPDIPLELKFENHLVIAQRGQIEPGQCTGVHARPGNQIYIVIKGGTVSEQCGSNQTPVLTTQDAGFIKWLDADEYCVITNTGDATIDFVLITFK